MDDIMKQALEIAKAQAGVRPMTSVEFIAYVKDISDGLLGVADGEGLGANADNNAISADDAAKSIKEKSITCLVCGKSFKMLGKKHLASHGLTADEYREKFGLKKGITLVCKGLARARRDKMRSMKLWERVGRGGKK